MGWKKQQKNTLPLCVWVGVSLCVSVCVSLCHNRITLLEYLEDIWLLGIGEKHFTY